MPTIVYGTDFNQRSFLKDNQTGIITFRNGDVFIGTIDTYIGMGDYTIKPKVGEYRYVNGDKYVGTFENHADESIFFFNRKIYILGKGEITFSDGTTINSADWLSQYNFTEEQWEQIYVKPLYPTEIRNRANRIDKERKQKLEEERLAKEQVEKQKQIAEQKRKNDLINKYGNHWGELVYNEEFTPGMTKAMVKDILQKQRHEHYYKKSVSTISGNLVEIWEFDTDLLKMSGGGFGSIMIQKQCPTLVFKNEKLTDIYR